MKLGALTLLAFSIGVCAWAEKPRVVIGSKAFTESYILAEILAQTIEKSREVEVVRRFGLGGTGFMNQALIKGEIDLYPEYTGTISTAILKEPELVGDDAIRHELAKRNLIVSERLGFSNTYALAVKSDYAKAHGLRSISDLVSVADEVRAGFGHEFLMRPDGYPGLLRRYGLQFSDVKTLEHSLAYPALERDEIDITDIYSTDAKVKKIGLVVLKDDRKLFPEYHAVVLARSDLAERLPRVWAVINGLQGSLDESHMTALNAKADIERRSFGAIASEFLHGEVAVERTKASRVWQRTQEHLELVLLSLMASLLVGVPLGVFVARNRIAGQVVLLVSGLVQTVPSLALLCFLIPFFGIGTLPALVALFLYGLLPIVLNTSGGLISIDPRLMEASRALGLTSWQRLRLIELPLASRSILSGVKTSAIIGIGTATLAALIGAGGYGAPIVTGLALNDVPTILLGAIPAAVMALFAHVLFEVLARWIVPRGLRS